MKLSTRSRRGELLATMLHLGAWSRIAPAGVVMDRSARPLRATCLKRDKRKLLSALLLLHLRHISASPKFHIA